MPTLGGTELWVVLLIVLVLFGGAKIPQMMRGLGEGMREFKKAAREVQDEPEPSQKSVSTSRTDQPS